VDFVDAQVVRCDRFVVMICDDLLWMIFVRWSDVPVPSYVTSYLLDYALAPYVGNPSVVTSQNMLIVTSHFFSTSAKNFFARAHGWRLVL